MISLEEEVIDMRAYQNRIKLLEDNNSTQLSQLRNKEEKIYNLEEDIRELQRREAYITQLEQDITELRSKEQFQEEEKRLMESGKYELIEELEGVRKRLEIIQS